MRIENLEKFTSTFDSEKLEIECIKVKVNKDKGQVKFSNLAPDEISKVLGAIGFTLSEEEEEETKQSKGNWTAEQKEILSLSFDESCDRVRIKDDKCSLCGVEEKSRNFACDPCWEKCSEYRKTHSEDVEWSTHALLLLKLEQKTTLQTETAKSSSQDLNPDRQTTPE